MFGARAKIAWLPAAVVVVFVLLPTKLTFAAGMYWVYPGAVLVVFWAFRRGLTFWGLRESALLVLGRVVALVFGVYLVALFLAQPIGAVSSTWLISVLLGVLLPAFVRYTASDVRNFRLAWVYGAAVAGIFCVLESAIESVPVYSWVYSAFSIESSQHWVVYRAEGSFGHPLYAGTFMAVGLVAAFGMWLETRRRTFALAGVGSAVGVVLTVSRGALLAAAVGIVLIVVVLTVRRFAGGGRAVLAAWVLLFGAVAGVAVSGTLSERLVSEEADGSDFVREQVYAAASRVLLDNKGGPAGLGAAQDAISIYNPADFPLESSLWQVVVGLGILGAFIFLVFVVLLATQGGRGALIGRAALVAFLLSISTYNAFDDLHTQHPLLGLLLILCSYPTVVREYVSGVESGDEVESR